MSPEPSSVPCPWSTPSSTDSRLSLCYLATASFAPAASRQIARQPVAQFREQAAVGQRQRIPLHRAAMFTAFFFSTIFLGSYLVNFALHGETHFNRLSPWWPFYWKLLASHIILSVFALPMILITFFLSLSGRFPAHKRLARYTFPIWLYVSVTGVIVYAMQSLIH